MRKRSPIYLADISEERARIARELHDGIAQELAAIGYALDSEIGRSDTSVHSRKSLREIRERLTELNGTVRNEIYILRSARDSEVDEQLIQSLSLMAIDFTVNGSLPNSELGIELLKSLQELARNAVEHGKASHLAIEIDESSISFSNNGTQSSSTTRPGFGALGVVERLDSIGWEIIYEAGFSHMQLRKVK